MSARVLHAAAAIEPWLALAVCAALVVLLADRAFGRGDGRPGGALDDAIAPPTERRLLALVLAVALGLRTVGWDDGLTAPYWFTQASTLWVQGMLASDTLWPMWLLGFRLTQVGFAHESVFGLPVLAALQAALGPRFGLPVLAGAVFGTLAVLCAWALGRRVRSPAFGLAFAAFVAVSPLALTWSRIGAYYVGAVPHVLLAVLVGWVAGRRGSLLLGLVAGAVAWASLYHYYAARVAIPLAFVAVVAGAQRAWRLPRGVAVVLVAAVAFGAVAWSLHGSAVGRALWPAYGTYPGNKGERDLADFVRQNAASIRVEAQFAAARYFTTRRLGWTGSATTPGLGEGGLVLVPVAALGAVGVLGVVRRLRRQWIWLVLAAAGAALPALSVMTARRMLVFDVAWCAFAAHGLLDVADWLGAGWTRRTRAWAAAAVLALVGAWSATAVFALHATLPGDVRQMPFGDAGFGDGLMCKRCLSAAVGWRDAIARDGYVVLFDNDVQRENRTSPGGLPMYGKIASAAAGRPERFAEAYALMAAWDLEPPVRGVIFDKGDTDFAAYLAAEIARADPAFVVWHFERPTAWERWLADELVRAGGTATEFPTPLGPRRGVRVVTPGPRRQAALDVIDALATGLRTGDTACVRLEKVPEPMASGPVFLLATGEDGRERPPEWLVASWREHRYGPYRFRTETTPIGAWIGEDPPGALHAEMIGEQGERVTVALPSLDRTEEPGLPPRAETYGLNCAARVDGHWWLVDTGTGHVVSTHPATSAVPDGRWLGLAPGPSGTLVLVSGDQTVLVFDPARGEAVARFAARVAPAVRDTTDECAPVAAGDGWIATANLRTGVASFYDPTGRDLGTVRLDRRMGVRWTLTALAGAGRHLAAAASAAVRVWRVAIEPGCGAAPTSRAGDPTT